MNSIVLQTNAGETTATAYITGNYNGLMIKSLSGTTCNVLSIPAIITNDTSITDLQQIVTNSSFVYRGYKNLPASFKTSKFKYNGGFAFTPNNLIAYTDTGSCTALTSSTVSTARVNLLKGLQDAYSGTTLKNEGEIKNIVGLSINTSSPSNEVINYAGNFVNNVLGGKLIFSDSNVSGNESNFSASGGIVTDIPGYRVHTFLTGGIFSVNGTKNVEVLVVAGGGAGGNYADGGGGAGGVLTGTTVVTTNAYNVTIGLGGVGTRGYGVWNAWGNPSAGTNGGDSSFSTFVSIGGGRSGYNTTNGASGGSGGGGGYYAPTPGNGTPGQGYAGGIGSGNLGCSSIGGGGGGAGGVGQNYSSAGIGGIGITSNIDGTSKVYATGGNAVMNCNAVTDGVDGTPNTGKGGGSAGGGSTGGYFGGDGGSGIVIIRYVYP